MGAGWQLPVCVEQPNDVDSIGLVFCMNSLHNKHVFGGETMKNEDEDREVRKHRVVTLITTDEKEDLQSLAWKSGRSVSGYLRYLIIEAIRLS